MLNHQLLTYTKAAGEELWEAAIWLIHPDSGMQAENIMNSSLEHWHIDVALAPARGAFQKMLLNVADRWVMIIFSHALEPSYKQSV